ncbi:MAG: D-alanine--D-alanine ligase [Proteobacteria bacterium]|nr:D-alanine--D-alanine ligase [Pseudomonadota bacterium]
MSTINREKIIDEFGHVVVLKGGTSVERDISLLSGEAVYQGLKRLGLRSTVIDVGDDIITELTNAKPDYVFIMLHGKGGEDGVIQGLLEIMKIPYTGSGVLASALAMDKAKSKFIWQKLDLNTADFLLIDEESDWQAVMDQLGVAVVKPVNGGSSIGIEIVKDAGALKQQYEIAIKYDSEVMAEKYIAGREFSIGVLQNQLLPTIQLETKREFFDYEAKYVDVDTRYICPPELSEEKQSEIGILARAAYESLGCEGLTRVDVIQDKNQVFYLLELNTVPGMTEHSFVPMAAKQMGIDFDELLLQILDAELEPSR